MDRSLALVRPVHARKRARLNMFARAASLTRLAPPLINFSTRKVGGLRFVKLGRFTFMFCISKEYKSL